MTTTKAQVGVPWDGAELEALVKKQLSVPRSAIDLLKAALAKRDR